MNRPFVAIVNSYSEYIPGHMHLCEIGEAVKAGVHNAGGVPHEYSCHLHQLVPMMSDECDGIKYGLYVMS